MYPTGDNLSSYYIIPHMQGDNQQTTQMFHR